MPAEPQNLDRFVIAQADAYVSALQELRAGWKQGHWMWFIVPQIDGLGHSSTARFYAIKSLDEAAAYLAHPIQVTPPSITRSSLSATNCCWKPSVKPRRRSIWCSS